MSSHPTFTVALRSPADNEPGTSDALAHTPPSRWVKDHDRGRTGLEHGGEVAVWTGVNMATQYPSAVSLDRLVNFDDQTGTPPPMLEDATLCDENCTIHSQLVHDAVRIIVHRVSIPDRFLLPWRSTSPFDVRQAVAFHAVENSTPVTLKGVGDDFDTLPMVPSRQNGDLLKICTLPMSR